MPYEGGDTGGGRRVYVGNIDYAVAEAQLKEEFNQFGPITNIAYKQGFAFIDFDDTRDAQDAISKMSGAETWGRRLQVEFARDKGNDRGPRPDRYADDRGPPRPAGKPYHPNGPRNANSAAGPTRNLFVANIPSAASEGDVQDLFEKCGRVTAVKFLPQKGDAKAGFVDFENTDGAEQAFRQEQLLMGNKLRMDYNNVRAPPKLAQSARIAPRAADPAVPPRRSAPRRATVGRRRATGTTTTRRLGATTGTTTGAATTAATTTAATGATTTAATGRAGRAAATATATATAGATAATAAATAGPARGRAAGAAAATEFCCSLAQRPPEVRGTLY